MSKSFRYWLSIVLICCSATGFSQTEPQISKPLLTIENIHLVINYEITNSKPDDIFKVWIEVMDSKKNQINALALSGDVGDAVSGGNRKKIIWDYKKDLDDVNQEVFLQVCAELIPPVEEEIVVEEETQAVKIVADNDAKTDDDVKEVVAESDEQESPDVAENTSESASESAGNNRTASYSRFKAVYRSALFPGLGFTGMEKSKMHLVKGLAGYGCMVTSVVFNRMAIKSNENYLAGTTKEVRDSYFKTAVRQDNISEIMAYSAIGIWAIELIWIAIEPIQGRRLMSDIRIAPGIDSNTRTPVFCLSVSF